MVKVQVPNCDLCINETEYDLNTEQNILIYFFFLPEMMSLMTCAIAFTCYS